ncbi:hypothetical protein CDV36_013922 [Fusarium kuroshium]|uniref:BTB domain-containing protein n=1 Tax=Fusarium kuroshium TaxID=2010991 RepID=A0A3M2RNQ0_9HYPO|nr:hypothetical protein CDV36_013922 [Fusarium kuroshium]
MSTPVPTVEDGTLSPYVGTVMALIFNNNYVWVHSRLIRMFPNFAARFEDNQLKMKPVPQGTAHIVVHYLYTGCYEGLKALGTREVDKIKYHFKMAVHVYDLAREYNLYHLEDMATDELQYLAPKLQLGTIITVLDEQEFTHTKISSWLRESITGEVMRVRKSATTDAIRVMGDDMKHNRPITGIICETVARLGLENQRLRRSLEKRVAPLVTMSAFSSSSSQPTISGFPFLNTTNRYMSFWTLVSHYITSKCRPTPWYPLGESHQDGLLTHDPPSLPPSETLVLQPKTRERLTKNRRGGLVVLGRVRDRPDKKIDSKTKLEVRGQGHELLIGEVLELWEARHVGKGAHMDRHLEVMLGLVNTMRAGHSEARVLVDIYIVRNHMGGAGRDIVDKLFPVLKLRSELSVLVYHLGMDSDVI